MVPSGLCDKSRIPESERSDFSFERRKMQYKAVITDLDGTAVDSPEQKVASERLAQAVQNLEAAGVKVCAATGRPESFAMPVIESMKLTEPCIVAGGTCIVNPVTREMLWKCSMAEDQLRTLLNRIEGITYGCLWNDYVEEDYLSGGWDLATFDQHESTFFFEICYVPDDAVDELVKQIGDIDGVLVTVVIAQRPGCKDIHITSQQATKEHAIYELEKMIGVAKEDMIGIGDGPNDTHLFNAVGHKVAMANAVDHLKEVADEVIGDIKDDGLAEYFERLTEEATA